MDFLSNFDIYNFRHIPSPFTPYSYIFKLKPGYNLIFDLNNWIIKQKKYFQIKKIEINKKKQEIIKQMNKVLEKAVNQTIISDVPVGLFLSGGVDSSLIASYLKDKNITAYTIGFDDKDEEVKRSKYIAKKFRLKHKVVYIKDLDVFREPLEYLIKIQKIYGEPIDLFQIVYSDLLLKEMKKDGIKVAIGGNGADELFYGYDGMPLLKKITYIKEIYDFLKLKNLLKFSIFKILNLSPIEIKIKRYIDFLRRDESIKQEYKKFIYDDIFREYSKEIFSNKLIDIFSWLGLRIENEHSITNVADIAGSIKGMEIRSPFLNKIVIDFACSLPLKYKLKGFSLKNTKWILKELLKQRTGLDFRKQKKMGFGYNIKFNLDKYMIKLKDPENIKYLKELKIFDVEKIKGRNIVKSLLLIELIKSIKEN